MFAGGACAAAFVIAFSGCANGGTKQVQRETQLVSLEAANSPGSSPWMDSTTSPDLPRRLNRVEDTATPDTSNVSGDQVGLYGGSTNQAVCDRDKMVNFLERNPKQAAAWRTAAHVTDIRGFASTLSPVVLLRDTRVTNHGFQDGGPTTFQSVLQTGTAVLVDNRGVPRVRCDSGSRLDEAQSDATDATEEFTGTGWQGLKSDAVVKVRRSDAPIESLKVVSMPVVAPTPSSDQPTPTTETTSPSTTSTGPGSTQYLRPPTVLSDIPLGQAVARPDPKILLPQNARVVPVDVAPLLTNLTSSTRTTSSATTTVPSTTATTTTTSTSTTTSPSTTTDTTPPSGSDTTSATDSTPVPTEDVEPGTTEPVEPDGVPTAVEPPLTTVPNP